MQQKRPMVGEAQTLESGSPRLNPSATTSSHVIGLTSLSYTGIWGLGGQGTNTAFNTTVSRIKCYNVSESAS